MCTKLHRLVGSLKGASMLADRLNGLYKIIQEFVLYTYWLKHEVMWDGEWMDSV